MSAFPGDTPQGRPGLPPLGPALSRPGTSAPAPAPAPASGAGGALPPFAPFTRPAGQGTGPAPSAAAPPPAPAPAPAPTEADDQLMPWETGSVGGMPEPDLAPEPEPVHAEAQEEDFPWLSTGLADEPAPPVAGAAPAPAEVSAPAAGASAAEELPEWLSWGDAGDEPEAAGPVAEAPAASASADTAEAAPVDTSPAEDWEIPGVADFLAGEEAAAADDALSGAFARDDAPAREVSAAADAAVPAAGIPFGAEAIPAPTGGADRALAGAFEGVADRLEQIARALRERPEEVLSGGAGSDPLQLLITGFVLGYAQGQGRSRG